MRDISSSLIWLIASLVRLVAFVVLGMLALALILGLLFPQVPEPRRLDRSRLQGVNNGVLNTSKEGTYFLDLGTGALRRLALPQTHRLEQAACSTWRDETGEMQAVGR